MLRSLILIFAVTLSACGGGDGASFAPATGNTHCGVSVGTQRISGVVTSVHDGDSINIGDERIRLASIDAPEWDQTYGQPSRAHLATLVLGHTVTVAYTEKDRYERVVGTVFKTDCTNVNLEMVRVGAAWYDEAYKCEIDIRQRTAYAAEQAKARASPRGLWLGNPVAPWVYRNGVEAQVPASCPRGDAPSL